MSVMDRVRATWAADWLWNRHTVARVAGCSLYAARRVLRRLERDGWIVRHNDGRSSKGQLYRRVNA